MFHSVSTPAETRMPHGPRISIQFNSIQFNSIQFNSIQLNSIHLACPYKAVTIALRQTNFSRIAIESLFLAWWVLGCYLVFWYKADPWGVDPFLIFCPIFGRTDGQGGYQQVIYIGTQGYWSWHNPHYFWTIHTFTSKPSAGNLFK